MKIKGTQQIEIEIDEFARQKIAYEYLLEKFGWERGDKIVDGKLMRKEMGHWSPFDYQVRDATEMDYLAERLFKDF